MKRKIKTKVLSLFLTLILLTGYMPAAVFAEENSTAIPTLTVNSSTIAFGGRTWWVIGDSTTGVYPLENSNSITLLAKEYQESDDTRFRESRETDPDNENMIPHKIPESPYGSEEYYAANPAGLEPWDSPNEYAGSTLQQKVEAIADSFSKAEQGAINARIIEGVGAYNKEEGKLESGNPYCPADWSAAGQSIENQRVWELSHEEVRKIGNSTVTSYGKTWWLRSSYHIMSNCVLLIDKGGTQIPYVNCDHPASHATEFYAARPALSLNLSSVLFASSANAQQGKSSVSVGSQLTNAAGVTQPVCDADHPVKFTMKDDSQTLSVYAAVNTEENEAAQSGSTLAFDYDEATVGSGQFVSCVMTDSSGAVQYYGKLADCSSKGSGKLEISLNGVADGTYTLQIFAEKENGDMETDLCSQPIRMTVAVSSGTGTVSNFGGTILHEHDWSDAWSGSQTHHWHVCQNGDCPETDDAKKDGYAEHTYDKEVDSLEYLFSEANCTDAALYYYSCECGAKGEQTFSVGQPNGHDFGHWESQGDGTHTRTCKNCPKTQTEDCTGGTATCQKKAVCTKCGTEYGEKNPSNHEGTESWLQTETTHQRVYSCCNTPISEAADHEWENGTCTVCQYPCKHTGGEATCTQKAICGICDSQYGAINPDNHKPSEEWAWENDRHYRICENGCGTRLDETDCYGGTATCRDKALCDGCGHAYGDYGNHSMTEHPANEKTCTEDGNSLYWNCSVCGKYYSDESGKAEIKKDSWIIPAAHSFSAWTDEVPADCIQEGTKGYKACTECDRYFDADGNEITDLTIPVNKDNHMHAEDKPEISAGCETVGYTAGVYCTDCGTWVSGHEEIPAAGHGELKTEKAKAATCTAEGYTGDKVCIVCNEVVEQGEVIQKLAHSWGEPSWEWSNDYTSAAAIFICKNDGSHTTTVTDKNSKEATTPATCTADGETVYTATVELEGKTYSKESSRIIPAAHTFGAWTDEVPADCIQEGTKGYKACAVCGKYFDTDGNEITDLTLPVNKDNHMHAENKPEISAGCETVGYTAGVYCTDCGTWVSGHEEIPAAGHKMELVEKVPAAPDTPGKEAYYICPVCGKYFADESGNTEIEDLENYGVIAPTGVPANSGTDKPETDKLGTDSTPETGDNSAQIIWMSLMLASGITLTGTVVYTRKKNYKK
ncbi:MAG TPA: hypothetical protein IAB98_11330 [Candidatus Egerieimonas intestinavium]|uniref:Uncharacterized protein n=1 Tax=Candidatus Egerieimonas intestinavium TaxID=2840777 RepID=A0A9D1ELR6_9FIRM|nr:hypothetical protein [Candidatus Egerieimonas intestinavium]